MTYKEQLREMVGDGNVSDDQETLDLFSKDQSFAHPVMPVCVVKPGNLEEVRQLVQWANESNTPLVPVSSGEPHFHGDTVPGIGGAVMVELSRMKRIIRVDRSHRVAMVEPGVTFGELIKETEKEGLAPLLPLSPKSQKSVVASVLEREPITMPRHHWDSQDPLRCAEVVFGAGDLFRTGSATGPGSLEEQWNVGRAQARPYGPSWFDFAKFIQGAQGTIGIVTWATVACRPLPSIKKTFFIPSEDLQHLIDFTYKILWKKLGHDLFILNKHNLACLIEKDRSGIQTLRDGLPQWVGVFTIEGFGLLPEKRAKYQTDNFLKVAQSFGLRPVTKLSGIKYEQMEDILSHPSEDSYWKLRFNEGCHDIFFITTLDKTPNFVDMVNQLAIIHDLPISEIGVYLQPTVQGTNCHCEFNLSFDQQNQLQSEKVKDFDREASRSITALHGFFSRPYGTWADVAYANSVETVTSQKKIKGIFDPNDIMNPSKLCF